MKNIELIKNSNLKQIIFEFNKLLSESLGKNLKKIILYGSYARNEQSEESDIDFLIIYDSNLDKSDERKVSEISLNLSLKYDVLLSIVSRKLQDYNEYSEFIPFYQNINNEGILIYG